jgi:hypothetical protein
MYIYVCIYENSLMKSTKTVKKEGEWLRENNIDGVNLINAYFSVNITMKPLCTVNLC